MKLERAVMLHGKPSKDKASALGFDPSRANFFGWLADQLSNCGVTTVSPRISGPQEPSSSKYNLKLDNVAPFLFGWRPNVKRGGGKGFYSAHASHYTGLIAHSAAVGPAINWALANPRFRGEIIAVAPWIDPKGRYAGMRDAGAVGIDFRNGQKSGWVEEDGRLDKFAERLHIIHSQDDEEATTSAAAIIQAIKPPPSNLYFISGFGHFVTGNSLPADYDLGNGLYGSSAPSILEVLAQL